MLFLKLRLPCFAAPDNCFEKFLKHSKPNWLFQGPRLD
jgi:hypothetical protein